MDPAHRFASHAIVRAAAWPLQLLDGFGEPGNSPPRSSADCYEATLREDRRRLWTRTLGDPAFRRALALANPELFARARGWTPAERPSKRVRQLERSLYRYLARAVSRVEPCDTWAGVTDATWCDGHASRLEPRARRHAFVPDLRPFQALLHALRLRAPYRAEGPWRANPTLHRVEGRGWRYCLPAERGRVHRELAASDASDALIEALLELGALSCGEASAEIEKRTGLERGAIEVALDTFVEAGVLVGGLDLPGQFACVWRALRHSGRRLHEPERSHWLAALGALETIAAELEERLETLSAEDIATRLAHAAARVQELGRRLGVEALPVPRAVLRCDLALGFALQLSATLRARLGRALAEYESAQQQFLPAAALRRAQQRWWGQARAGRWRLCEAERGPALDAPARGARTWEECAAQLESNEQTPALVARWADLLGAERSAGRIGAEAQASDSSARGAPWGALLVRPSGSLEGLMQLRVLGITEQVSSLYARYGRLPPFAREVRRWHRRVLRESCRRAGIEPVELLSARCDNPNALARRKLCVRAFDLWGAQRGADSLLGAELSMEGDPDGALVHLPGRARPHLVLLSSSAQVRADDHEAQLVLRSSFREGPLSALDLAALPCASELARGAPCARVELPCGAVVQPRRTVLAGPELETLLALHGQHRHEHWLALAERHDWTRRVTVHAPGQAPLLMPTRSPLALDAALKGCAGAAALVVQELGDDAGLELADGQRHVVELALPFERARHLWSPRRAGAPISRRESWLQFNVGLCREQGSAHAQGLAVLDRLARALRPWEAEGLAGGFFFMRKPPDLRVRVRTYGAQEELARALAGELARLRGEGRCHTVFVSCYEPEQHLFGGAEAMTHVHDYFVRDTGSWLALARLRTTLPREAPGLAAAVLADLLARCLEGAGEAWDVWCKLVRLLPEPPRSGTPLAFVPLEELCRTAAGPDEHAIYAGCAELNHEFAQRLHDVWQGGRLAIGVRQLLAFLAQFTFHRWGLDGAQTARVAAELAERTDPKQLMHRSEGIERCPS